ncbi:MAG: helix-turn-helix domain-containing protein [Thermoanaerobaculia bacterium]
MAPLPVSPRRTSFGAALRRCRQGRGVGLRELSRSSGVSLSYLSLVENDRVRPPSAATIAKLARALDRDIDSLLETAGIVPETVLGIIRQRPRAIGALIRVAQKMTDDEIYEMCNELR